MTAFTVFDPATGRILRTGFVDCENVQAQAQSGEAVLPVESDWSKHCIKDGLPALKPRTLQDYIVATRIHRDALLAASDWTQLPDVPLSTKSTWAAYRQALRDITNQPDQLAIEWPVQPV